MTFNLVQNAWLPARRESGRRERVRPADLTSQFIDDPIVGLDFPRPDWNAAVTEWLIGLSFMAFRPEGDGDWAARLREPPSPEVTSAALEPFAFAFDFDGDGPRAFQDFDSLDTAEPKSISGLLMDAPGENTLKNNADLFIKRGGAEALSLPCTAAALITLQTYAPSGGAGHRTSLRGGGPLTTLVAPRRKRKTTDIQTLWDRVWSNTPPVNFDPAAPNDRTLRSSPEWAKVFPWLGSTLTSQNDRSVTPEDATPALAFFACPRRIRLIFPPGEGVCALTGEAGPVASGLRTINYGANYLAWIHPLSPYRRDKKSGALPLHPHAGASDYGDCAAWWGLEDDPALVLKLWESRRKGVRSLVGSEGIEAFGFDMDNAKARQWLEVRLPWVPVYGPSSRDLRELLRQILAAADEAARGLRYAVKIALYAQRQKAAGYRLPDTLPRDALREPAEQLWRDTEGDFRELVDRLVAAVEEGGGGTVDVKSFWLGRLREHALRLFGQAVDLDGLTDSNPHRLLYARQSLGKGLSIYGSAAKALQLSPPSPSRAKKDAA